MAKSAVALKSTNRAVSKGDGAKVPAHIAATKGQGRGTSTDAHDNLIPMGRILQKMSQEVEKKGQQYVAGAEVGDIYFKNLTPSIIKGEEGFLFQPCHYRWGWTEWLPRGKGGGGGAGFVSGYPSHMKPKNTKMVKDPMNPERQIEVRQDNGNLISESRYHSGFIIPEDGTEPIACVLPFSGSGHAVSRMWMGMMNRKIAGGEKKDSWFVYYRMKSVSKTKNNNTWSLFEVTDAGPEENGLPTTLWAPSEEDLARGEALYLALASGEKTFNEADATDTDTEKM